MAQPRPNYPAPAPNPAPSGPGFGVPRLMGGASMDEASILSRDSLQAVSCRYSSWCTGRQLVPDPGPLSRLHKTAAWHEIEAQCEGLEAADLRITEIDLSFADEDTHNQSLRFELVDVSMRGGTHARARDWTSFALDGEDFLEGEEEEEEGPLPAHGPTGLPPHATIRPAPATGPPETMLRGLPGAGLPGPSRGGLSGSSAMGLRNAAGGGGGIRGLPVAGVQLGGEPLGQPWESEGYMGRSMRPLHSHHSQLQSHQQMAQQQQQMVMQTQQRQRSGQGAHAQAQGLSLAVPAAPDEEDDHFGEYQVNTPLRRFPANAHPYAGLPSLPSSSSSPSLTRPPRHHRTGDAPGTPSAGLGGAVPSGGHLGIPTGSSTVSLAAAAGVPESPLPLPLSGVVGVPESPLTGAGAGGEESSWSGSGSGSWSGSLSGSGPLSGPGKSLGMGSRMGSTPGSTTERPPQYKHAGESLTVTGDTVNSTSNSAATGYSAQGYSGRYLVQPGGKSVSADWRQASVSCRYTSNAPQAPVAFAQIVSQRSESMAVGQVYSSPWPSEPSPEGHDHPSIYEMQGGGLKGYPGSGERRLVGWRLPHSMRLPSGKKPSEPLLKKLMTSSKMLVRGTTRKMAGVLVRS